MVVQDHKLSYYKDRDVGDRILMGYLDFDCIGVDFSTTSSKGQVRRLRFQPKGCKKVFLFKSNDRERKDLKEWKRVIESNLASSTGSKDNTTVGFTSEKRFWRVPIA